MSDLELAKVKLIDTIGKYNLTASNIGKFQFDQLEENVFATMMVEFAQELTNDLPDVIVSFCGMKGKGFCSHEYLDGKCNYSGSCVNKQTEL